MPRTILAAAGASMTSCPRLADEDEHLPAPICAREIPQRGVKLWP